MKASGAALVGAALGACRPPTLAPARRTPFREHALVPPEISWDRVIGTTVGLRPYRESGFVVKAEAIDEKTVIHNYGHGGAGMSLSWGTAYLAAELALAHTERSAAVLGSGIVGLTTARQLQRHGFDVTIYARTLPPDTTSNMSWASFTPLSNLVAEERRTPEWNAQFIRSAEIAYREHQLLVGRGYGVSWIDEYLTTNDSASLRTLGTDIGSIAGPSTRNAEGTAARGRVVLGRGEHPFASAYAVRVATLRFEPSIYLDELTRDVLRFGGRFTVRSFESRRDIAALPERLIVNCTGLGAQSLFDDAELAPIKGQLIVLVPQPEVTYAASGMLPRSDGIVLGHMSQKGVATLDVDEAARTRVVERAISFFASMRVPPWGGRPPAPSEPVDRSPPPLESFFARVS